MDRLATNVAKRYIEAKGEATFEEFERAVKAGIDIQAKIKKWADGFPRLLRQTIEESEKTGVEPGWLWGKLFWDTIAEYRTITEKTLPHLRERIDELGAGVGFDWHYLNPIGNALAPEVETNSLRIWDGANTKYLEPGGTALNVDLVEKWGQRISKWVDYWTPVLKKTLQACKKSYKAKVKRMR